MQYPRTAQEMVDRLRSSRPFLIGVVVNDNYPAVRARFNAVLQSDQPKKIDTPEKLINELLWWERTQGSAVVDDVIVPIPYRNQTGSQVLEDAMAELYERAERSDGIVPKAYTGSNVSGDDGGGSFDWTGIGSIGSGIAALVGAVDGLANGNDRANAQNRTAVQIAQAQAYADLQAAQLRAETLKKYAPIIGTALVVVVLIVLYLWHRNRA